MAAAYEYIPKPEVVTAEYLKDILDAYYAHKWNGNEDTVNAVKTWRNWPMVLRMPDVELDYTMMVDEGKVVEVRHGLPEDPRILTVMMAETMQRIYYDETTSSIELIGGRIKVRGNETERRRLLAAISYLTW